MFSTTWFFILTVALFFVALVFPPAFLVISLVGGLINFFTVGLQFISSFLNKSQIKDEKSNLNEKRLVSVIIPARNEPPLVYKNTIRSVSKNTYSNFEVIVLDSNTKDKNIWLPIENYCKELGKKFRFFHVDKLEGFKAGALNWAIDKINPSSEYVAVIDADYEVKPAFLEESLKYFGPEKLALVQFPQSYTNVDNSNLGIALEYEHFFQLYMNMARFMSCVNSTGTLSVYRTSALRKVHFFDKSTMTEDADIGVRLILAGYETLYVHKNMGKGLMPYDIESYIKQKTRWSLGNAQVLRKYLPLIIFKQDLSFRQKLGLFIQLTAWINFTLLPICVLIVSGVIHLFSTKSELIQFSFFISAISIFIFLLLKFLTFVITFRNKQSNINVLRAFLVHIGMTWVYSSVFWRALFMMKSSFERTNKFILPKATNVIKTTIGSIISGFICLMLTLLMILNRQYFQAFALMNVAILYFLILYVYLEIRNTKELSSTRIEEIEKSF